MKLGLLTILVPLLVAGCKSPNTANIQLRKDKAELEKQLKEAAAQRQADRATIVALQKDNTIPTLPAERLDQLFTVTGLEIDKLTGFRNEGLKVYATPVDKAGDVLKAAGDIKVEVFDLARGEQALLGRWDFPLNDAAKNWYDSWVVSGYAVTCDMGQPTAPSELTVRVTFTDALTGRAITAQRVIKTEAVPILPPSDADAAFRPRKTD